MGAFWDLFKKEPQTPVSVIDMVKNIIVNNFRGIIGVLVPLIALPIMMEKSVHDKTVQCMWLWMCWSLLIQPVNIPVSGLIPIFFLPMTCAMSSAAVCTCYFNENVALFILGGWLLLLFNNSGLDRRITLCLLSFGKPDKCTSISLICRASFAALVLSMISNRLIVTANLIQYVTPTLTSLQASTKRGAEPDYDSLRCLVVNAIHTSSAIGGIAIAHASFPILAFRSVFYGSVPKGKEYADVFNYTQYTAFALGLAIQMYVVNLLYHIIMVKIDGKSISEGSQAQLKGAFLKQRNLLPKNMTLHEKLSIVAVVLLYMMHFGRWTFIDGKVDGWSKGLKTGTVPHVKDSTVSAIFVIVLSIVPCSYGFFNYVTAKKKSQLPPQKAESAILWWKFIDKNTIYGYMFLIGGGLALSKAIAHTGLDKKLQDGLGKTFTDQDNCLMLSMIVLVSAALANMMSSVAALVVFLPFVMNMIPSTLESKYDRRHFGALGVGIGTSFGFLCPFLYTPAYFAHYVGKVPRLKMVKYGLPSVIICAAILCVQLCFAAEKIFTAKLVMETLTADKSEDITTPAPEKPDL